ncbi:MAG: hypothetical protein IJS65_03415 [Clostridia bacterium]|nr:hypothetical protein [Clostridia bacterium]
MSKRFLSVFICFVFAVCLLAAGSVAASGEVTGEGTWAAPYVVTSASGLIEKLGQTGDGTVYITLGADIYAEKTAAFSRVDVRGSKCLDLNGHTVKSKLSFGARFSPYSLFVIESGASLTVDDSAGSGEIIFDRFIPSMGEANAQTDIFLDRPLNVFDVRGALTVNGGEITAGHYESEYYTYTDGYIYTDSRPSPGTVNSVTPGNAVTVRSGGSFVSNGGEYYGRGFVLDEDGNKESACAALALEMNASAVVNSGDFYGKSCADVVSSDPRANLTVNSGNFYARYDSRITVDKTNGTAYYVNVDCGRVGVPLYAFDDSSFSHVYIDGREYNYTASFDDRENEEFKNIGADGTGADVTVETIEGLGTKQSPYLLKNETDIDELFYQRKKSPVYVRLNNDITDCVGGYEVWGNVVFDLNGHKLSGKLGFNAFLTEYTMITVTKGSYFTVEDSAGSGEIIYDRFVPDMGDMNEQTDIIADRPLTVLAVSGTLTVNGGEITAGHYESEYYTYTKKYNTGGGTSAQSVNSVTPGTAIEVRDGGRFTSNGGEYYGRGFTIDENGEKDVTSAALRLKNGAAAIINDGDFYGKSNSDVVQEAWGASLTVLSGKFYAEYNNRVTVDKRNGVAYYVNVDCGRIGLPLYAFTHTMKDRETIKVNGEEYVLPESVTSSQSEAFEKIGQEGTGATITAEPKTEGASRITDEKGGTDALEYCPSGHFEIVHENAAYFKNSFSPLSPEKRTLSYTWKVLQQVGSRWAEVRYTADAPVSNGFYATDTPRLDLYDLARHISGGMTNGSTYRITAHVNETWSSNGTYALHAQSANDLDIVCAYENIDAIDLPDSLTGIVWPEHGKSPRHITVEDETFTANLIFQEGGGDAGYSQMSESSVFRKGNSYRLCVKITPKSLYGVSVDTAVTVGGKTVSDKSVLRGVLTGYIPLEVAPGVISDYTVGGRVTEGCKLTESSPLTADASMPVTVTAVWYKDGAQTENGSTATAGAYYARLTLKTKDPYIFKTDTKVKVFGSVCTVTYLSADYLTLEVRTDTVNIVCSHTLNTNGYAYDAERHWFTCSVCGEELSSGTHSFGDWAPRGAFDARSCKICGYEETRQNGRQPVPYIRFNADVPVIGNKLPVLTVCEADSVYAELEQDPEWYVDEVYYENYVERDSTVYEAGHVYYGFIKIRVKDGYYFTNDTEINTVNPQAAGTEERVGGWNHLEAFLVFTPREISTAAFTLPAISNGQTYGDMLSGIDAYTDGVKAPFTLLVTRNGSSVAALVFDNKTDSWRISSGDVAELMSRPLEPASFYKLVIGVAETGKKFDNSGVTVNNGENADTYELAAGDSSVTLTAYYHLNPLTLPEVTDFNDDKKVDAEDVSELIASVLFEEEFENKDKWDINGDGETDAVDALMLITADALSDEEKTPEVFIAIAYNAEGKMTGSRVINLKKGLSHVDLEFLKSASDVKFFYLDGNAMPVSAAFVYKLTH